MQTVTRISTTKGSERKMHFIMCHPTKIDFPGGSVVKESACNAGDTGDVSSIPGSGRSPGRGNGNLLQYSCLENSMDKGTWWGTVHWVAKSRTRLK